MDIKAYYRQVAGGGYLLDEPRIRIVKDMIGDDRLRLLDVGCHDGNISVNYKKKTNTITGIDIHMEPLKMASQLLDKTYLVDIDNEWEQVPSDGYDVVVMSAVLEHIFDYKNVFSEVRRVLCGGGIFINAVPNVASIRGRIELMTGQVPAWYKNYEHIRMWTRGYLNGQIKPYGFVEERFTGCFVRDKKIFSMFSAVFPSFCPIIISKFRLKK